MLAAPGLPDFRRPVSRRLGFRLRFLGHDLRRLRRNLYAALDCDFVAAILVDRSRPLAHHLLRRLVLAHALEGSLAHQPVAGPAAELRLDHHLRLDPVDVAPAPFHGGDDVERRLLGLHRMQPLPQIARGRVRIAGADAPGIDELALVVIADHQRADRPRHGGRRRIAADHEFLCVRAFGLDERVRRDRSGTARRRASTRCLRATCGRRAAGSPRRLPRNARCSGSAVPASSAASSRRLSAALRSSSGCSRRSWPSRCSRSNT